jgi:hypothetical protein
MKCFKDQNSVRHLVIGNMRLDFENQTKNWRARTRRHGIKILCTILQSYVDSGHLKITDKEFISLVHDVANVYWGK